jgi:hypothetical protein
MRKDRRMDGRKDITKLIAAFHNFANAPIKMNTVLKWKVAEILRELLVEGERN